MNNSIRLLLEKETLTNKEVQSLVSLLETASKMYYNTNTKMMTDEDFDLVKDKVEEFTDLDIGAPVAKGQISAMHSYPSLVGSLRKVNNIDEFRDDFLYPLVTDEEEIIKGKVTLKFDGNSLVGEHDKVGNSENHITRGRGGKGLSLNHVFNDRVLENPFNKPFGIKYEVIIKYSDFDIAVERMDKTYANPRSLVAGKLGDDNAENYKDLFTLVPIGFTFKNGEMLTVNEQYRHIKAVLPDSYDQFIEPYSIDFEGTREQVLEEIDEFLSTIIGTREFLDFMIDGLVIEISNDKYKNLPAVNGKPKHAIALKLPYMEKVSEVIGFEFDLSSSHTGRITPMVLFKPVQFNGATQKRVSLANYKRFTELKLGIGSPILVQYRNDVLSYVMPLESEVDIEPYPFINECPNCGEEIEIRINEFGEKTLAHCPNKSCSVKISGRILQYIEKLDIKGFKESTINRIVDQLDVNSISDIYLLDKETLLQVDGFKEKTADNIVAAISSKNPMDYELLGALGISNFQLSKSKLLLQRVRIEEMLEYNEQLDLPYYKTPQFKQLFLSIEGFKDKTYNTFIKEFEELEEEFITLINNIIDYGLEISEIQDILNNNDNKPKYNFVVTGSIENWNNRKELEKYLEDLGHKVVGSVSSKTDYLINNDTTSNSGKNKKAKELGIKIISEHELLQLL